ncbi:hypothetical protein P691DRAFT_772085 [Macrolepiota fuliginosa MF-IS2]|uniref:Uncharacterized protein n=1 Tax=Macrolepiota fuliginosa MF-IS2 TaxID=1400762 RepID=A0A9P5XKL9_9AGAR|nr:hypothetical protein P691DRAFT_772085 [Macrolepiota fuliginosa MF-IS2]
MPEVLAHLLASLAPRPQSLIQYTPRAFKREPLPFSLRYFLALLCIIPSLATCAAQTLINGQTYTNGLAIINAPFPGSEQHVGSTIAISIELSGNGKLPFAAFTPGSGLASSYELLEIYLASSATGLNLTISSGTGLLTGEVGTVRHHDTVLPSCIPTGQYNLTFYETSVINSIPCFTITPIPISISNNAGSSSTCSEGTNQLQTQPQPSSDYGQSPFNPNLQVVVSTGRLVSGAAGTQTRPSESNTRTPTSVVTVTSPSGVASTSAPQPSESSPKSSGLVTLVIVSQAVATFTNSQNQPVTTSYMTTRTTAVLMSTATSAGFIPINAGKARLDDVTCIFIPLLIALWAITLVFRLE